MNPSPVRAPYVSARWRATVVKVLLVACAVVSVFAIITDVLSLLFPSLSEIEGEENIGAILFAFAYLGLGLATLLIFLTTVVFFSVWLYRSYENLRAFGHWQRNLHYSSGWAVGSFFVPFVNLVTPYRAVKELWQNSVPVEDTRLGLGSVPSWFPLWWFFWLTSNFASNIYFRMSWNERVSHQVTTVVGIVADALSIGAAILAFVVVSAITKRQEESSATLNVAALAGPPLPEFGNTRSYDSSPNQSAPPTSF